MGKNAIKILLQLIKTNKLTANIKCEKKYLYYWIYVLNVYEILYKRNNKKNVSETIYQMFQNVTKK